jgi:hypothetical protein
MAGLTRTTNRAAWEARPAVVVHAAASRVLVAPMRIAALLRMMMWPLPQRCSNQRSEHREVLPLRTQRDTQRPLMTLLRKTRPEWAAAKGLHLLQTQRRAVAWSRWAALYPPALGLLVPSSRE